jgi:hypothetical protein
MKTFREYINESRFEDVWPLIVENDCKALG